MLADGARHFHDFDGRVYLNCANHGPLPRVTEAAIHDAVALKTHPNRIPDHIYFSLTSRARNAVAPLIGADPECITLGTGESHGAAVAALGFPWKAGDEVVIASSDFPANLYIWCNAARSAGAVPRIVKPQGIAATTEEILDAISPGTRIVAVSHVDFGSGEMIDIARLADICAGRDIFLAVDATQSAGIVPMDLAAMPGISLLTVGAYKWLLAPYGTGFAAFQPDWVERIRPTYVTWTAAEGAEKFNALPREDWTWASGARRFDAPENASFLNVTGMARSAEFISTIGLEAMHEHVIGLLDHLEQNLPQPFRRRAPRGAPLLSVECDDAATTHAAYSRLTDAGIIVSLRENGIRVAPHIYNSFSEIDTFLSILAGTA